MIIFAVADFNSKPKVLETHLLLSKWVYCGSYPLLHGAGRTYQAKLPTEKQKTKNKKQKTAYIQSNNKNKDKVQSVSTSQQKRTWLVCFSAETLFLDSSLFLNI